MNANLTKLEEAVQSEEKVLADEITNMGKQKIELLNKLEEMETRKQEQREYADMPEH